MSSTSPTIASGVLHSLSGATTATSKQQQHQHEHDQNSNEALPLRAPIPSILSANMPVATSHSMSFNIPIPKQLTLSPTPSRSAPSSISPTAMGPASSAPGSGTVKDKNLPEIAALGLLDILSRTSDPLASQPQVEGNSGTNRSFVSKTGIINSPQHFQSVVHPLSPSSMSSNNGSSANAASATTNRPTTMTFSNNQQNFRPMGLSLSNHSTSRINSTPSIQQKSSNPSPSILQIPHYNQQFQSQSSIHQIAQSPRLTNNQVQSNDVALNTAMFAPQQPYTVPSLMNHMNPSGYGHNVLSPATSTQSYSLPLPSMITPGYNSISGLLMLHDPSNPAISDGQQQAPNSAASSNSSCSSSSSNIHAAAAQLAYHHQMHLAQLQHQQQKDMQQNYYPLEHDPSIISNYGPRLYTQQIDRRYSATAATIGSSSSGDAASISSSSSSAIRSFACTFPGCTRAFPTRSRLKRHIPIHSGEKPYICPVSTCLRAFNRKDNMLQHTKTHNRSNRRYSLE